MSEDYVVPHNDCYRIAGTRVALDSIVYAFLDGDSAEAIQQSFPVLTLEQVYGAIAYYLAHRNEVDAHLRIEEADFEENRQLAREQNPQLYQRLTEARRRKLAPRS
ncbi:MAG: DUF433 domain-containing protein [Acidobacteria bacterium]|nr:DUF433 domain-containing protein [Acidobacteriota bacterium]MBI3656255.1 DUF433 domain-containing protein [Acidobacteriota bacterium]